MITMHERIGRLLVVLALVALPVAVLAPGELRAGDAVEIHGRVAQNGGWTPADITVKAGEPLHLRLTSDDVMHSFAVGQSGQPPLDVKPGEWTTTTLEFDKPGKYTFYCARWCGPDHWRMRGTIEVTGQATPEAAAPPLYVTLGLDIDADHPAAAVPAERPDSARGAALGVALARELSSQDYYRAHSPASAWQAYRAAAFARGLSDQQVWDLVAFVWRSQASDAERDEGRQLFAANCAACHGASGAGNGVMAAALDPGPTAVPGMTGHQTRRPADFTDPHRMLGASPALLQGKMLRGGMGTGMPYFGPIFTADQLWSLVAYLWTFQMD